LNDESQEVLGPQWLAHRFDESTNQIRFVDYDRGTRSAVPFLTDDYLPKHDFHAMPRERAKVVAAATAPVHFVFHSGFCCSTLFARCFDQPGLATTFSEPMLLNDVFGWRKRGAAPVEVGRLLDDALSLLARPFAGDLAAIVKPSTVVNGLAPAMLGLRPTARAVLMYAPVEDFLTSIAKKGLDGRRWIRELFLAMRHEGLVDGLGFGDEQFFGQTDLQIAAVAWIAQQRVFAQLFDRYPDRVRSLESGEFLSHPRRALEAGGKHFELSLSTGQLEAAESDVLSRNSKDGKSYSTGAREAEYSAARSAYGDEIDKVAIWARAVMDATGIAVTPGPSII